MLLQSISSKNHLGTLQIGTTCYTIVKTGAARSFGQKLTTELQRHISPCTFQLTLLWNKNKYYPDTMPRSFGTALVYYSTPFACPHSLHMPDLHTQITTNSYGM